MTRRETDTSRVFSSDGSIGENLRSFKALTTKDSTSKIEARAAKQYQYAESQALVCSDNAVDKAEMSAASETIS